MKKIYFENIIELDEVNSTNTYLKERGDTLLQGTVVFTGFQTSGRGRLRRKWFSEKGKCITCSFLITDVFENIDAIRISFLFSLAVKDLLMNYLPSDSITLKWPNDVLINNKKICGILSEYSNECAVIGIGLNIFNFKPSKNINKPWTTLESETDKELSFGEIKTEFIDCVNSVFERYCTNDLSDIPAIWFRESEIIDKKIEIRSGNNIIEGSVSGIDQNGILLVKERETGIISEISSGDITYND